MGSWPQIHGLNQEDLTEEQWQQLKTEYTKSITKEAIKILNIGKEHKIKRLEKELMAAAVERGNVSPLKLRKD